MEAAGPPPGQPLPRPPAPRPAACGRPSAASATVARAAGAGPWAESISHGELLRDGHDQRLEVDPARLRFLFQGVSDRDMKGKKYGEIPWRLGILEPEGSRR